MAPRIVDFTLVTDRAVLARHLSCSADAIAAAIERPQEVFREHRIPKRNPRRLPNHRLVYAVMPDELSDAYKTFLRRFYDFARERDARFPSPHAHGYLPGRSILSNASAHVGARVLMRADIRNFFPSISRGRVERIMRDFGVPEPGAREISAFLTIDGALALGLPSSPLVANLACRALDEKLAALAQTFGCKYTRYADDVAISGADRVPSKIELSTLLQQEGFQLAEDKFRVTKRGQAFYVTGLSISDPGRPRAAAPLKRRLRQELYFIESRGLKEHLGRRGYPTFQSGIDQIDGRIRFLRGIEPELGASFQARWAQILEKSGDRPGYFHRPGDRRRTRLWLLDESVVKPPKAPAGPTTLLGMVIIEDEKYIVNVLDRELAAMRQDAFYGGRIKSLNSKGLHYTDLPEDARGKLADVLQELPLRAYVVLDVDKPEEAYQGRFLRLLGRLLERRFEACDGDDVRLLIENNPQMKEAVLKNEIMGRWKVREQRSARRPSKVEIAIVEKSDTSLIALPDLLMGFLTDFLDPNAQGAAKGRFERLRDKFRVIQSIGDNQLYSRRRPIEPWPRPTAAAAIAEPADEQP
jgi:hypothetical protein